VARVALARDEHWTAPEHMIIEVVSMVRGRHLGGKLSYAQGHVKITQCVGLSASSSSRWVVVGDVTAT